MHYAAKKAGSDMRLDSGVHIALVLVGALLLQGCGGADGALDIPARVDYNFHIRPILSNSCYVCHGPDASTREADLRLDVRQAATSVRQDGGRAIVPGRASRSLLIERITSEDPDHRMPPPTMNKVLSRREVALLSRWIEQGAEYKRHWAFLPPGAPEAAAREESPIDFLVESRLQREGLRPAAPASKGALVRRASYVLTGLPPSLALTERFMADSSADAYERVVDELLDSPRFGERWARHWMDLVRYAEAKGHEFDYSIDGAWIYRDYLIRAFNEDVPYDQIVAEHLAGDLLPSPRLNPADGFNESSIGTSYYFLGEGKHSPVDTRIDEAERVDNIIDVTTKTFQALTVACARCHDHKFDPIPTTDYYSLYGIVESARFSATPLITAEYGRRLDSLRALQDRLRHEIADQWMRDLAHDVPVLPVGSADDTKSALGAETAPESRPADSDSTRVLGDFRSGTFDGWYPHGPAMGELPEIGLPLADRGRLDSLSLGYVTSRTLAAGVPAALRSPTFTIDYDSILVVAAGYKSSIRIVVDNLQLIQNPIHGGLLKTLDGPELSPFRFDVEMWKGRKAYVELIVGTYLGRSHITDNHRLLRNDSSYFDVAYAVAFDGAPPQHAPAQRMANEGDLARSVGAWTEGTALPEQVAAINRALRSGRLSRPGLPEHVGQTSGAAGLGPIDYYVGLTDGNAVHSAVFDRGNYRTLSGNPVPHRFLSVLDTTGTVFSASASGRLDLARAVVDPSNPLTARVMVNRLWHHAFGRGIVATVDNFGAQGELPSHPDLLDYLAARFVELDYSIKSMLREMVLSRTFRRATATGDATEADPDNRLLSHYSVRRLEAEAIRDVLLAVSGRLDSTMYGPPVPTHLTEFMEGRGRPAESGPLDGDGRRSIYLAVRRNFLSPMMLAFDTPIPFSTFGARNTSNVPAQSLTMLNDPFVADQARNWAHRLVAMTGLDTDQRIEYIYMVALSRRPTVEEVSNARNFMESEARRLGLPPGEYGLDEDVWAAYCHVVFNLKEFIYLV